MGASEAVPPAALPWHSSVSLWDFILGEAARDFGSFLDGGSARLAGQLRWHLSGLVMFLKGEGHDS